MGTTHRLFGVSTGLGTGLALGWAPWRTALGAVLAGVVAHGRLSPDLDQSWGWRLADRLLPDELLGEGGPMRHRGLSHWWGLPVLAGAATLPIVPASARWVVLVLLVGWCSHLAGDFLFGRAQGRRRGHGIPLLPWWGHVGIGLDAGGRTERLTQALLLPLLLGWQMLVLCGWAGPLAAHLAGLVG